MSQPGGEADPIRRRAGLLSALVKLYVNAQKLMDKGGSADDAQQLHDKLHERYTRYLESHEIALATYPDRDEALIASHVRSEQRHQQLVDSLEVYIVDGTKPDDLESLHAASLFSVRSKRSVAQSCPALHKRSAETASLASQAKSTTISETRVQAALAKRRFAQEQAEQAERQKKIDFERDVARQHRELDKRREEAEEAEARERKLNQEAEERERQMQEESDRRKRELDQRQRELLEEAELHKREMDSAMQLRQKQHEMENLQTELRLREQEEIRSELGSDYESDSDRGDVTRPETSAPKPRFQLESDQSEVMQKTLRDMTGNQHRSLPVIDKTRDSVNAWMNNFEDDGIQQARVPSNAPQRSAHPTTTSARFPIQRQLETIRDEQSGYGPPTSTFDDVHKYSGASHEQHQTAVLNGSSHPTGSKPSKKLNTVFDSPSLQRQDNSDVAALFGRALLENRMPSPKQLEFDGNPKTFMAFLASFKTNIERKLSAEDEEDAALKLTYLLQHCTGDAKYLIDDCALLDPIEGFDTAMKRLHDRYGQGHVIARSYIESVTKGPSIKLNDSKSLVKLTTDMVKCQSVLSRLAFTSDLDSSGTLKAIVKRLPESLQVKWARRGSKILKGGRASVFSDLVEFIREEEGVYSSMYGEWLNEFKSCGTGAKQTSDSPKKDKPKEKAKVTTLATTASESSGSTAGPPSSASTSSSQKLCDNCEKPGHFIGRCIKFRRLKRDQKVEVIKKKNLCFCCLKSGHGSKDCERRCVKCDKKHHVLIHDGEEYSGPSSEKQSTKDNCCN